MLTSQNEEEDGKSMSYSFHSHNRIAIDKNRQNALIKSNVIELKEQCGIKEIDASISFGTVSWQDGSTYTGCFKNSKRFGLGTMTWRDGSIYTGNWNNDDMNGDGKYENKDSFNCSGSWQARVYKTLIRSNLF